MASDMLAYLESTVAVDTFGHCVKKSRRVKIIREKGLPGRVLFLLEVRFRRPFRLNIILRYVESLLPVKKF